MKITAWEEIDNERFRRAADYWDQARGDRLLPRREDIKFAAFPDLAADCTILSRNKPDELRIWYAGIDALRDADMADSGTNLFDAYPAALRRAADTWITRAFSCPCGYISHQSGRMPDGTDANLESLNLPLMDLDGVTRYVLTVISYDMDDIGSRAVEFFRNVSRLRYHPIDIGAGCPAPIDVTAATDFT